MFYRIEKDRVEETSAENWESGQSGVAVLPTRMGRRDGHPCNLSARTA